MDILENELIAHCIEFMSSKEVIVPFLQEKGLRASNSMSYKQLASLIATDQQNISIDNITQLLRAHWEPSNIDAHIAVLCSGKINGHNWHGARPSMLHLSIQERVREFCNGIISIDDYLRIGEDIIKHEYFMVAAHDICESSIIKNIPSVIPPIGNKSVTDFVFDGVPYDLKVSSHPDNWKDKAGKMTINEKKQLALELYEGADSDRMRKQAEKCKNNWGLNRMYYLVSDQTKWESNPKELITYLIAEIQKPENKFNITVHGYTLQICFIEH